MTYPPRNPGYSAGPQPPAGYGPPAVRPPDVRPEGPGKPPVYLRGAVVVLGLFAYLASFGPLFNINASMGPFGGAQLTASGMGYWTIAALISALLAAAGLVARGKTYTPVVAVTAVLGVLLVIGQLIGRPDGVSVGWALWLVLLLTLLQAGAAVVALLMENGVITAPAPRPRYDAYGPYGPPPAGYYGQSAAAGPPAPGYPSPYPAGGYPAPGYGQPDNSPETPPTGFPSLGQQQPAPQQPPTTTSQPPSEPAGSSPS